MYSSSVLFKPRLMETSIVPLIVYLWTSQWQRCMWAMWWSSATWDFENSPSIVYRMLGTENNTTIHHMRICLLFMVLIVNETHYHVSHLYIYHLLYFLFCSKCTLLIVLFLNFENCILKISLTEYKRTKES